MAVYFAVFGRQTNSALEPLEQKFESAKLLPSSTSAPLYKGRVEDAKVVKLEAASIAEAQIAVKHFFPSNMTDTPVIIAEAQFKEA
jgi:hypothetical protein